MLPKCVTPIFVPVDSAGRCDPVANQMNKNQFFQQRFAFSALRLFEQFINRDFPLAHHRPGSDRAVLVDVPRQPFQGGTRRGNLRCDDPGRMET